jgi:hypothetical protein
MGTPPLWQEPATSSKSAFLVAARVLNQVAGLLTGSAF